MNFTVSVDAFLSYTFLIVGFFAFSVAYLSSVARVAVEEQDTPPE